jgi:hypothetical protein
MDYKNADEALTLIKKLQLIDLNLDGVRDNIYKNLEDFQSIVADMTQEEKDSLVTVLRAAKKRYKDELKEL